MMIMLRVVPPGQGLDHIATNHTVAAAYYRRYNDDGCSRLSHDYGLASFIACIFQSTFRGFVWFMVVRDRTYGVQ